MLDDEYVRVSKKFYNECKPLIERNKSTRKRDNLSFDSWKDLTDNIAKDPKSLRDLLYKNKRGFL